MTERELTIFSDFNPHIIIEDDISNEQLLFRDESLFYYQNDPSAWTAIKYHKVDELNEKQLVHAIKDGLQVEQMTRITGYASKVSGWNKGKRAELKDRKKWEVNQTQSGCNSACPIAQEV